MVSKKKNILIVGDRILVRPDNESDRTRHGLYLPPGVSDREKVATGTVVNVGPGYAVPNPEYSEGEPWATDKNPARYIPLQAQVGDIALYLRNEGIEVEFDGDRYQIVPQPAVLMLIREELHENIG